MPAPLLLIAIDGLRYDFLNAEKTPNLWKLAQQGSWSPSGMQCQYPAQTSPNFRSIVTGLHVENHGILDNLMHDVEGDRWFDYFGLFFDTEIALEPGWYDGKKPIWSSFQDQTGKAAGSVYFPFSNVSSQETKRLYYDNAEICTFHEDPNCVKEKLTLLADWLADPINPVSFGLFYFCEPDLTSHYEDIYGEVVTEKIKAVDEQVGFFLGQLEERGLDGKVNIIFVSDHGYTNAKNPESHVDLVAGIDPDLKLEDKITVCTGHPCGITAKKGVDVDWQKLYEYLAALAKNKMVDIYLKKDFPKKYHYAGHPRAGEIIYVAKFGYVALLAPQAFHYYSAKNDTYGEHGYRPEEQDMRPIFFAIGPDFKTGFRSPGTFENIDIYPLMCKLLGIVPEKHDGDIKNIEHILAQSSKL